MYVPNPILLAGATPEGGLILGITPGRGGLAPGTSTLTLTPDGRIEVSSAVLDLTATQGD